MKGRLSGRVVATTREGDTDDPLTLALRAEGAEVRVWPTLSFLEPRDPAPLRGALERLDTFGWLAFTSARAATAVTREGPFREGHGRVAAVGDATARALRDAGWPVHRVGEGGGAVGMARSMAADGTLRGTPVLFFAGSKARPDLERELVAEGAVVHKVEVYRTEVTPPDGDAVRADLEQGVAAVLFASPSAVRGLSVALEGGLAAALLGSAVVAIGATTAAALLEAGLGRVTVADTPSVPALVEACVKALNNN